MEFCIDWIKAMKLHINVKKVAKHLKTAFTFRELEIAMKSGKSITDLVLVVPAAVMHSGSIWTSYGHLSVISNKKTRSAVLKEKSEVQVLLSDYL